MSYFLTVQLILVSTVLLTIETVIITAEKLPCINHNPEINYFDFFNCSDHEYCCGHPPNQFCCPKLPVGAIVGIVLTAIVFFGVTVCCVVACCLWCDCCLYKQARAHTKRKSFSSLSVQSTDADKWQHHRAPAQHLTLKIGTEPNVDPTAPSRTEGVILGARVSVDLQVPPSPLSPTTPMSITSPSEFSKLISHDWTRHKHKDEINPYQDTVEADIQQPIHHRSGLP